MEKQQVKQLFDQFLQGYDASGKDAVWANQSTLFRDFWQNRVMKVGGMEISDTEADPVIAILDRNAKGNTKNSEAVARAMIAQGAWRRMFNDLHETESIRLPLNAVLVGEGDDECAGSIDELYQANAGRRNNLTGPSGNAVNAMLAAYSPTKNLSVISMSDRLKLLNVFGLDSSLGKDDISQGKRMTVSHRLILDYFRELGVSESARTISVFLYSPVFKSLWRGDVVTRPEDVEEAEDEMVSEDVVGSKATFYMEKELENFLIKNWEHTALGKNLDLIDEDDKFSQQYPTGIGRIDILAQEKKTGQYVVIELKKDQTSDDTVGQVTRYMGWLEENKTNGQPTKGIIIASQYDERLYYALKKVKDVEVYLYKVDFELKEFKS